MHSLIKHLTAVSVPFGVHAPLDQERPWTCTYTQQPCDGWLLMSAL